MLGNFQASSGNTYTVYSGNLEWFPSVFSETFVDYEAVYQMSIKISNLNSKIARQR
jgi:hypothetical protein